MPRSPRSRRCRLATAGNILSALAASITSAIVVVSIAASASASPPGGHSGGAAAGAGRPGGSHAGVSGGAPHVAPKPPNLGGLGNFRDTGPDLPAGRFSSAFAIRGLGDSTGVTADAAGGLTNAVNGARPAGSPRAAGQPRTAPVNRGAGAADGVPAFSERFGAAQQPAPPAQPARGAGATAAPRAKTTTSSPPTATGGTTTNTTNNIEFDDASVDIDAALGANGYPVGSCAPATDCAVAVPTYASLYGVYPAYYPVYYPSATSSAAVTYTVPNSQAGATTTETQVSSQVQPLQPTQTAAPAATPMQYPATITAAVDALDKNSSASTLMRQGGELFRGRDYLEAAKSFRQAIPLDVDNALPRFSFAHALFALGDYENAAYSIRRGLDLMPDWVSSGNNLWAAYGDARDFRDQRSALASWCKLNPTDGESLATLGYVDFFTGNLAGAKTAFTKLQELRPDDPIAPFFLTELARVETVQPKAK